MTPSQVRKEALQAKAESEAVAAKKEPPAKFSSSIDDGTKQALTDFSKTDAGKIAKDLDGKSLGQVKEYMDSYPGVKKSV
jgi:hypothetical protein